MNETPDSTVHSICIISRFRGRNSYSYYSCSESSFSRVSSHRLNLASKIFDYFCIWGPCIKHVISWLPDNPHLSPYITSSPRVRFWSGNMLTVSKCYCTVVVWAMCTQKVCLFMDVRLWWWPHKANFVNELLETYYSEVLDHPRCRTLPTRALPPSPQPSPILICYQNWRNHNYVEYATTVWMN